MEKRKEKKTIFNDKMKRENDDEEIQRAPAVCPAAARAAIA